jgi:tetratricopeptide (TPR) repeat protein
MAESRGKYSEAVDYYTKSLVAEPNNGFALLHRAIARSSLGDMTGAQADLDASSQSVADRPAVRLSRAFFEANMGWIEQAKKDLAAVELSSPKLPGLAAVRGRIAQKSGDQKAAVEAYTAALQAEPKSAEILMRRAESFRSLDDKEKALADTEAALKAGYKDADIRLLRANIFFQQGNREATAREAELAMSEHPDLEYAFVLAGRTYDRLGMTKEALRAFDRAIELNPAPYVYINRAMSRPASDIEGQLADYDQALKLEPKDGDAVVGKAHLLDFLGKKAEASALYAKAAELLAKDPESDGVRAIYLYKGGRIAEAEQLFAEARKGAQSPGALNSLCWNKATAGIMLESALKDCRDALKQKPDEGAYLDSLGMVLLKLGKFDDALSAYDRAIAHKSGAASLMGRAIAYARKGDRSHAKADADAAVKLWPAAEGVFARDYGLKLEIN